MRIVRKNELACVATFTPTDGSSASPSTARATLVYTNTGGTTQTDIVTMALQTDGVTWRGLWDSAQAAPGVVQWMIECGGGLKAAAQGSFYVDANTANLASV